MIKITDPDDIKQYYDAGTNSYIFKIDNVLQDIEICFYNFYIDANIIAANIRADNIYAKNIQAHYIYCEDITCEDITAYGIYAGNIIAYDIKAGDTPEEDDLFYCIRACGNINASSSMRRTWIEICTAW